ncbi:hypothetical protein [Cetobacterium sp.]|uniref:hypothetical protein n=1 Tax=Cetobacterium sp. TaxID=2071632 RepID=UPI003F33FB30
MLYKIILEFKNNVVKDIKVLPEVSATFKVSLIDEIGQELKNGLLNIPTDNEFKVVARLQNAESNELLDHVVGTSVTINYGHKKILLEYNEEKNIYEGILKIEKGRKSIDGSAEFPGYFYYQSDIYIIEGIAPKPKIILPKPPKVIELPKIEPPKPYEISTEIFPGVKDFITQKDLLGQKFYIVPKLNKKELTEDEIHDLNIKINTNLSGRISNKKFIDSLNCYGWEYVLSEFSETSKFKNPQGDKKIKVVLENKEKNKTFNAERNLKLERIGFWSAYGNLIMRTILFLTSLGFIVGYIKKKRFKKGEKIVIEEIMDGYNRPNQRKLLKTDFLTTMTPYKDDRCNIEGLVFVANKGCVGITADSFAKLFNRSSVNKVYINGDYLDKEELKTGKKDIYRLYNEDNIEFVFDNSRRKYLYKIEK